MYGGDPSAHYNGQTNKRLTDPRPEEVNYAGTELTEENNNNGGEGGL